MLTHLNLFLYLIVAWAIAFAQLGPWPGPQRTSLAEEHERLPAPALLEPDDGQYFAGGPVTFAWTSVQGAARYSVAVWQDAGQNWHRIYESSEAWLTLPDLEPDARYVWTVSAVHPSDSYQDSEYGSFGWFAVSETPMAPVTPQWFSASKGTVKDQVYLEWATALDASYYRIERRDPRSGESIALGRTEASEFYDDTVEGVQEYRYRLIACNDTGCSEPTVPDTGWAGVCHVLDAPVLEQPLNGSEVQFEPDIGDVALMWGAVEWTERYQVMVEYADTGELAVEDFSYGPDLYIYGLEGNLRWKVRSIDAAQGCDAGPWSEEWSFHASPAPPPLAPAKVTASKGLYPFQVEVSWQQPETITMPFDYTIYRAKSLDGPEEWAGYAFAPPFEDTGVEPGVAYYFWVEACHASRGCARSDPDIGWSGERQGTEEVFKLFVPTIIFAAYEEPYAPWEFEPRE